MASFFFRLTLASFLILLPTIGAGQEGAVQDSAIGSQVSDPKAMGIDAVSSTKKSDKIGDWIEYSVGPAGGTTWYTARVQIFMNDAGGLMLCGAGFYNDESFQKYASVWMKDLGLYFDDDLVLSDMTFFTTLPKKSDLASIPSEQIQCRESPRKIISGSPENGRLLPTKPEEKYLP